MVRPRHPQDGMTVEKLVAWMPMTDAMIEDQALGDWVRQELVLGDWVFQALADSLQGPPAPRDPMECRCGFGPDCLRHSTLTDDELAAAAVLHGSDITVGEEGLGGFYAGQAEEVMLVLRQAGFSVTR